MNELKTMYLNNLTELKTEYENKLNLIKYYIELVSTEPTEEVFNRIEALMEEI